MLFKQMQLYIIRVYEIQLSEVEFKPTWIAKKLPYLLQFYSRLYNLKFLWYLQNCMYLNPRNFSSECTTIFQQHDNFPFYLPVFIFLYMPIIKRKRKETIKNMQT